VICLGLVDFNPMKYKNSSDKYRILKELLLSIEYIPLRTSLGLEMCLMYIRQ